MSGNKSVLGLVGSPNRAGLTNELVSAVLEGARGEGATIESIQMSHCVVEACKDCIPWICNTNQKCTYEDKNFELLSKKILDCGALVIGTPVYWGDTSGMVRYLFLKMYRVFAGSGQLKGLPALGIAIAGGSGNGLTIGLKLNRCQPRVLILTSYKAWKKFSNDEYEEEKHCHICGKEHKSALIKRACLDCYKTNKSKLEFPSQK